MNKHDILVLVLTFINVLSLVYAFYCSKWSINTFRCIDWELVSLGWLWMHIGTLITAWCLV